MLVVLDALDEPFISANDLMGAASYTFPFLGARDEQLVVISPYVRLPIAPAVHGCLGGRVPG